MVLDIIIDNLADTMRMHNRAQGLRLRRRAACGMKGGPGIRAQARLLAKTREALASAYAMAYSQTRSAFAQDALHQ
ncbi:MAG: hypothetical protein ACJ8G3_16340 [Burkholderiaceae bacterium]